MKAAFRNSPEFLRNPAGVCSHRKKQYTYTKERANSVSCSSSLRFFPKTGLELNGVPMTPAIASGQQ